MNDLAECYLRTDRHDDALPVLASVLTIDPDHHRANVNTALAMLAAGRSREVDYHEALDHIDRALTRGPSSPRARRVRAAVLVALDRVDEAISALEAIFRDDSRDVTPLIEAGRVQAVHDRLADAVATFTRVLDVRPDEPRAAVGLVEALLARGAWAEAETALGRAAALPGSDPRRLETLREQLEEARRSVEDER